MSAIGVEIHRCASGALLRGRKIDTPVANAGDQLLQRTRFSRVEEDFR